MNPWTVVFQAPLPMGSLRQEYWSGLPLSSPGNLPDPGIEPESPALAGKFFTTEPPGETYANKASLQKKTDIAFFTCQAGLNAFCGLSTKSQQVNYKHLRK